MDIFKQRLRKRNILLILCMLLIAALYFFLQYLGDGAFVSKHFFDGYRIGFFISLELMLLFVTVQNTIALRSEHRLREKYIKENDERTAQIRQKSGSNSLIAIIFCLAISIVVAGYYNETVFFTLVATLYAVGLIGAGTKLYFYLKLR